MTDSQKKMSEIVAGVVASNLVTATAWAQKSGEVGKKFAEDAIDAGNAIVNQLGEVIDYVDKKPLSNIKENSQNSNSSGNYTDSTTIFQRNGSSVFDENEKLKPLPMIKKTNGVESETNSTFATDVSPEYALASIGSFLGRTIDSGVTNLKELVNKIGDFASDEWKKIATKAGNIHSILDIDKDGKVKQYFDNDTISYFSRYLQYKGFFNQTNVIDITNVKGLNYTYNKLYVPILSTDYFKVKKISGGTDLSSYFEVKKKSTKEQKIIALSFLRNSDVSIIPSVYWLSDKPFSYRVAILGGSSYVDGNSIKRVTSDGSVVYSADVDYTDQVLQKQPASKLSEMASPKIPGYFEYNTSKFDGSKLFHDVLLIYTKGIKKFTSNGVGTQSGAVTPDTSTWTNDKTTKESLRQTYPDSYNNAISQTVIQPTGQTLQREYVPVPVPTEGIGERVGTLGNTQAGAISGIEAGAATDTQAQAVLSALTQVIGLTKGLPVSLAEAIAPILNPPTTGTGITPPTVLPSGSSTSLYKVHAPSKAQLDSFGAWLWSPNFVDQIVKLFSDPMQSIIGLHRIYTPVPTGGSTDIKVGYISSGVSAPEVTSQFTTVDCGTVQLPEYFGSILDYKSTDVQLYLPFVGIISLSVDDCMRGSIHILYKVDVFTGACLAEVSVTRDGVGGVLYQYSGNAAATLPISSGSYAGVIQSLTNVVSRGVVGYATGGVGGALLGGGSAIISGGSGTKVQRSGGFSGNAGVLGGKIPYLIIQRAQTEIAQNTEKLIGYGSNSFVQLKTCKGLTKVKGVHVDVIPGTKEEKKMIEEKLIDGVIIN